MIILNFEIAKLKTEKWSLKILLWTASINLSFYKRQSTSVFHSMKMTMQ